ncbi:hypothetical protein ACTOJ1_000485 [Shigella flexneri]
MAIIGKYNLQDFNIDKKDLNKKFFKNSENEKIFDIFDGIKKYLSNTDYSMEENEVRVILLENLAFYYDKNRKTINNSSSLFANFEIEKTKPYSYDYKAKPTIILNKSSKNFQFDKNIVIFHEIIENILNLKFNNLKIIKSIKDFKKTKNKDLESHTLGEVLFHEIGHYVQYAWQAKNNLATNSTNIEGLIINSLINPIYTKDKDNIDIFSYSGDFLETPENQRNFLETSFSESFADVFALMMMDQFYPSDISNTLQKRAIQHRELEHESISYLNYYSIDAMKSYIDKKDEIKNKNIDEKVSLAVEIATKQAFNTFVSVFSKEIEDLNNAIDNNEKFIDKEDNKKKIQEKIRIISYLGGVIFPDGNMNNRTIPTIAEKLENEVGLKGVTDFIYKNQVRRSFIGMYNSSNANILYGEAKRYFIDRMINKSDIKIKATKQENYDFIENKIADMECLDMLNVRGLNDCVIIRENKKRIDSIINSMIKNKMITHIEADNWIFDESKNYADFLRANSIVDERMHLSIKRETKPKKTFKDKIKDTINKYSPETILKIKTNNISSKNNKI